MATPTPTEHTMGATPSFDMVLFGGTGDLAMRKLLPALYQAHQSGTLHPAGRIVALGRGALTLDDYLAQVRTQSGPHLKADFSSPVWTAFAARITYLKLDAAHPADFDALAELLGKGSERVTVCYLATAPSLFADICAQLARVGLNHPDVRVVLEKPLGHDLDSSDAINAAVAQSFAESQLYRIDHYLGKESVQNLMAMRFGNVLFEPLWRREWVDNVQITIAEDLGVEGRGEFYDKTGALRDMVQNHLLQLLCMVAMEPPASLQADAIRDEKLKVLQALKPFTESDVATRTVRGQYRAGAIDGKPVAGYLQEPDIDPASRTETFVAIKAEVVNWRWAGVPFFLRTGKRLQERLAEIVINFRAVPLSLFGGPVGLQGANRLVIRLQPDESISLHFLAKEPGDGMRLHPTQLDLDFESTAQKRRADAYERLLLDVIRGQLGLFMRRDELTAAWRWVEPILDCWERNGEAPKTYTAGTWGPAASSALLSRDGASWHEEL
ncbi:MULTISPECIES: glucose-6-phosphate dehydrogenase [unclassified Thiomonas]|uniref:glucose-6-phosphate dehydrogenase n=2 Tax=Thiomonas TaxID=32012 RepID=UPI0004DBCAB6|nr:MULTISPECIES: glucose-6-phosphate dehydrogenase [unclassified Thiomonas]CQR41778.1 Glucose-6-phosphate 1-dehydrogenase [Thiomonas sp. CB3]VDY12001.1 Glucose-6-phosphate 1-dehydrogenase (G6PD) [Thiomonas sp. OC7]CDW95217.1 Glucose-6-phosphate 1-dehydrogenase [Thiomonas sp. CB2]VDY03751.1 Glucose-6-phosphate 1-dehydrogenase [Thiomonas sp. Bio17B3]VDY09072.1 Glucose-6-phosphate 1-dehydrogenase [Thiomonas sp. Sup16B3]